MTEKVRRAFKRKYFIPIIGFLFGFAILSFFTMGGDTNAKGEYLTATLERATITNTVSATGTLQALRTVQVGSQISGQVQALYADFNSLVQKGQLLARIDPRTFQTQVTTENAQLESAQARIQSAEADLLNQQANLTSAEANLEVARVTAETARSSFQRAIELFDAGLVARSEYDTAKANADSAAARVTQAAAAIQQARASIRSREASLTQATAEIAGAKAGLERAALNLELTNIYSPVDGVVISRNVDIGQTVAASLSAPTLFMIANDLTEMQLKASIDEADIGKISVGAPVQFTVDAYSRDTFQGKIDEIRLEPQTIQNVVTYNVIVGVSNPEQKLKPGMTANITVTVASKENVLTVPNAALRFTPTGFDTEKIQSMLSEKRAQSGTPPPAAQERPAGGARGSRNGARGNSRRGVLWTLDLEGKPQPNGVRLGLTDGTRTEVMGPDIEEGETIITGSLDQGQQAGSTPNRTGNTSLPFGMPGGIPGAGPGAGPGGRGRGGF